VRLDRSLTTRRAGPVTAARRSGLARAAHRPARPPGADPAHRAASTRDTSLPPAPASDTPDIVEFGSNLTR